MLRLVCLQSVVNGGLKPKIFDFYRREILQTYGFEHMLSLNNLEKAGLLKVQDARNPYASVKKTMKLIVEEDPDAPGPEDISHVYSGYAPLSVRLVQNFTKAGAYRGVEEVRAIAPMSSLRKGLACEVQNAYPFISSCWTGTFVGPHYRRFVCCLAHTSSTNRTCRRATNPKVSGFAGSLCGMCALSLDLRTGRLALIRTLLAVLISSSWRRRRTVWHNAGVFPGWLHLRRSVSYSLSHPTNRP